MFCKWTRKEGKEKERKEGKKGRKERRKRIEKEKGGTPRHYKVFSDFQEIFQMAYSIKSHEKVINQGHKKRRKNKTNHYKLRVTFKITIRKHHIIVLKAEAHLPALAFRRAT